MRTSPRMRRGAIAIARAQSIGSGSENQEPPPTGPSDFEDLLFLFGQQIFDVFDELIDLSLNLF